MSDLVKLAKEALRQQREKSPTSETPAPLRSDDTVAMCPAAQNARMVYWETSDGRILGPAIPEYLARDGGSYWIVATFEEEIRWINADRLRSRKAFEAQREVREVEPIRTFSK